MNYEYDENFYKKFKMFTDWFMNTFYDVNITGKDYIPTDGNFLLAGNHINILDAWLLMYSVDDVIRFMVDDKLYRYKLWKLFFSKLGTFAIDPNSMDITAVRKAIDLLKNEFIVTIFPEGQTHDMNIDLPFKPGVPKIAYLAKKDVVPFGINGSYKPGSKLNINFGEPIDLKKYNRTEYDSILETEVRKLEKRP